MTGDIINLRTARKRRKRADKERQATENRLVFGRSKSERIERKADLERKASTLDGHLRERDESGEIEDHEAQTDCPENTEDRSAGSQEPGEGPRR